MGHLLLARGSRGGSRLDLCGSRRRAPGANVHHPGSCYSIVPGLAARGAIGSCRGKQGELAEAERQMTRAKQTRPDALPLETRRKGGVDLSCAEPQDSLPERLAVASLDNRERHEHFGGQHNPQNHAVGQQPPAHAQDGHDGKVDQVGKNASTGCRRRKHGRGG